MCVYIHICIYIVSNMIADLAVQYHSNSPEEYEFVTQKLHVCSVLFHVAGLWALFESREWNIWTLLYFCSLRRASCEPWLLWQDAFYSRQESCDQFHSPFFHACHFLYIFSAFSWYLRITARPKRYPQSECVCSYVDHLVASLVNKTLEPKKRQRCVLICFVTWKNERKKERKSRYQIDIESRYSKWLRIWPVLYYKAFEALSISIFIDEPQLFRPFWWNLEMYPGIEPGIPQ